MNLPELQAQIDPHSATASALRRWATARIDEKDRQLRVPGVEFAETEALRYAIAELELLVSALTTTPDDEG